MSKFVTKICNLLTGALILVILLIVGALLIPRAMGYDVYAVLSGSMEPYYHVGSIVYVDTDVEPEEINVGDPVTFKVGEGTLVTHRVTAVLTDTQEFMTKGDANEDEDLAPVPFQSVIGKAGMSIPMIGYISIYMKTKKGLFGIAAVFIVIILLQLIPEIVKPEEPEEKRREKKHE